MKFLDSWQNKLIIGGAQFGQSYGITNKCNNFSINELESFFDLCSENKLHKFDTSPQYGQSEKILGKYVLDQNAEFITKTPFFAPDEDIEEIVTKIEKQCLASRFMLGPNRLKTLMLHQPEILFRDDFQEINKKLLNIVEAGLVENIGVSVYTFSEIERAIKVLNFEIIQLPLNIFDQRLLHNGYLQVLKEMGVCIHARSIFLQGLILDKGSDFQRNNKLLIEGHKKLEGACKRFNISTLNLCASFVNSIPFVDHFVCGFASEKQLNDFLDLELLELDIEELKSLALYDEEIIDPRRWH